MLLNLQYAQMKVALRNSNAARRYNYADILVQGAFRAIECRLAQMNVFSRYCLTFSANDCVFSLNEQQKVYYHRFKLSQITLMKQYIVLSNELTKVRSDKGLTLETLAFRIFHGGNSTFINSFDKTKFLFHSSTDVVTVSRETRNPL